jgi:23S rRNA (guanosine2251-2'-O)-methyltransferase
MEDEKDLIFGAHSILECLKNESRNNFELIACDKIEDAKLKAYVHQKKLPVIQLSKLDFHKRIEKFLKELGGEFKRPPSGIALFASKKPTEDISAIYSKIESRMPVKVVCLDQITDLHNIGAISRTSCFYGVDYIVHSLKNGIPLTPTFYRIASGSTEHIQFVYASSLTKFIEKLGVLQFPTLGLSESGDQDLGKISLDFKKGYCLVLGSEDKGISNAVQRVLKNNLRLEPKGPIGTLNVSVAAAIALDRLNSN